jgi:Fe-S-cluster-containing hydrogenase component 2
MVCSFKHEGLFSSSLSRITVFKEDEFGFDYPVACRQCNICLPTELCPVAALKKNNGIIQVDYQTCIGCENCVRVCKFTAVKLNEEGKPIVCDLCEGDPKCVLRCPTGALGFHDADEFSETVDEAKLRLKMLWGII